MDILFHHSAHIFDEFTFIFGFFIGSDVHKTVLQCYFGLEIMVNLLFFLVLFLIIETK